MFNVAVLFTIIFVVSFVFCEVVLPVAGHAYNHFVMVPHRRKWVEKRLARYEHEH